MQGFGVLASKQAIIKLVARVKNGDKLKTTASIRFKFLTCRTEVRTEELYAEPTPQEIKKSCHIFGQQSPW